jgi:hypothetical protein
MTEQTHIDRATTLAEMAPHRSVTISTLAGEEGRFSPTQPLNEPPVSYLESAEAPAFVLANTKRGIGLGSKRNTVTPASDGETLIIVTGRRTLCLVGQASSDEVIEIPHESVAAADYHTGLRAYRLALQTPQNIYHCWLNRKTDTDLLATATNFIEDRQQEVPETLESDDNASKVMYRGQPVEPSTTPEAADERDDDEQTVMYRGRPVDGDSG